MSRIDPVTISPCLYMRYRSCLLFDSIDERALHAQGWDFRDCLASNIKQSCSLSSRPVWRPSTHCGHRKWSYVGDREHAGMILGIEDCVRSLIICNLRLCLGASPGLSCSYRKEIENSSSPSRARCWGASQLDRCTKGKEKQPRHTPLPRRTRPPTPPTH